MENTVKKDTSRLLIKISGILLVLVAAVFAVARLFPLIFRFLSYSLENSISNFLRYFVLNAASALLSVVVFSLPLIIAGIMLLTNKDNKKATVATSFTSFWYLGSFLIVLFILFIYVVQLLGIGGLLFGGLSDIYSLLRNISYDLANMYSDFFQYVLYDRLFIVVSALIVAAIFCVLAVILKKKSNVVMFIITGVSVVNFLITLVIALYLLYANHWTYEYYLQYFFSAETIFELSAAFYRLYVSFCPIIAQLGLEVLLIAAFALAAVGMTLRNKREAKLALEAAAEAPAGSTGEEINRSALDSAPVQPTYTAPQQTYAAPQPAPQQTYAAPQPAPQPAADIKLGVADEILKYESLYNRGIITKEQFEAKKNQLLRM